MKKQSNKITQSGNGDWFEELSDEDRNLIIESEISHKREEFIDHASLMQRLWNYQFNQASQRGHVPEQCIWPDEISAKADKEWTW